jgi:hypothetical protein
MCRDDAIRRRIDILEQCLNLNIRGKLSLIRFARQEANESSFFASLVRQYDRYRRLSDRQWGCIEQNYAQANAPKLPTEILNFSGISEIFGRAAKKLKWPKIRLQTADGKNVVLSRAGERSRNHGSLNVTDGGRYGANVWYGRISTDGTYHPSANATEAVRTILRRLSADPVNVATEYGKLTGQCCFCGLSLTTDESLMVGYGPVCATNYGLSWGKKRNA